MCVPCIKNKMWTLKHKFLNKERYRWIQWKFVFRGHRSQHVAASDVIFGLIYFMPENEPLKNFMPINSRISKQYLNFKMDVITEMQL